MAANCPQTFAAFVGSLPSRSWGKRAAALALACRPALICTTCKDRMRQFRLQCGHRFCAYCRHTAQHATCPLCPIKRGREGGRFADCDSFDDAQLTPKLRWEVHRKIAMHRCGLQADSVISTHYTGRNATSHFP